MKTKIISASILSANLAHLADDVNAVLEAGADWIHFDVMDHHYVDNLTFGACVCDSLVKSGIHAPIDVHLMVNKINPLIHSFAKAGASLISIHPQKNQNELKESLDLIHGYGLKAGLVLNPDDELNIVLPWLEQIELVLIMSVHPGFAAQKFIVSSLAKLTTLRKHIDEAKLSVRLSIDGGVNTETIGECARAGADTFVSGSAIFKSQNYSQTLNKMRESIAQSC